MNDLSRKTNTASCRLNTDQMNRLDAKAKERGLPRSMLIKQIILDYLDEEIEHTNLIQQQLVNVMAKIDKNEKQVEFFQQMFYAWLVTWFGSHPKNENLTATQINSTLERRNTFINNFINGIFNEDELLYETLFHNGEENSNIEEEI